MIQPKNDDPGSLSMHERELDMDKEADYNQGQPLNEVSNCAELSPALNYLIKFENDKPGPLLRHKSKLDTGEELVSDQGQPGNEVSNYAKLSPAEMDDKNFCKNRTCSIQQNDDTASVSKHELELDMGEEVSFDQGQRLNEAVACTKYYSAEKEEKDLGKNAASDIIELEDNLGSSCYAENEYDAYDLPEKGTLSSGNSTSTSCYQEMEDTAFHKHNRNFKEVEENVNSSNINTNELSMDEGARDKEQQTLKEHSFSNVGSVFCIEAKEISFINASRNTFSLEAKLECSSVTKEDRFNTEKHVHECRSEGEGIHFSTKGASVIDLRDGLQASSFSNESKLSMSIDHTCNVCCAEDKRSEMVVITRQDFATEVTFAIDQETEFVKKHATDEDEGSALDKDKHDGKKELFNPEMETKSVMECSPGICEDSTSSEIVSCYNRNDSGQIVDIEGLQEELTLSGRCSNNDNNEIEVTLEYGHDFKKDQENESIKECLSDIREESPLYETRSFKTRSYSDNENDESLSDIPDHSALYEVVSLSSGRSETEFYVGKYFCNKELTLKEDSAFFNCCSKHELTETQDLNSNTETESLLEPGNVERDKKNCECMSDVCEDTDGVLYETFSFCKIDKEECCECFEEVDMACCCQCCECVRNSLTNMHE